MMGRQAQPRNAQCHTKEVWPECPEEGAADSVPRVRKGFSNQCFGSGF